MAKRRGKRKARVRPKRLRTYDYRHTITVCPPLPAKKTLQALHRLGVRLIRPTDDFDYLGSLVEHNPSIFNPENFTELSTFGAMVAAELERARETNAPTHSGHEGYAIILEELEEFWLEVMKKPAVKRKRKKEMIKELVQIAAMAQRTAEDVYGVR